MHRSLCSDQRLNLTPNIHLFVVVDVYCQHCRLRTYGLSTFLYKSEITGSNAKQVPIHFEYAMKIYTRPHHYKYTLIVVFLDTVCQRCGVLILVNCCTPLDRLWSDSFSPARLRSTLDCATVVTQVVALRTVWPLELSSVTSAPSGTTPPSRATVRSFTFHTTWSTRLICWTCASLLFYWVMRSL